MLKKSNSLWIMLSQIGGVIVLLPFVFLCVNLFVPSNENWNTLSQYWLKEYISNTLILIASVGVIVASLGSTLAFLMCYYRFPLKKFFEFFLVLPLAIPAYISAYTYSEMLSYTGVIQKNLRNVFGLNLPSDYFDIMTLPGAIFIFSMALFPYVYLMVRSFLIRQDAGLMESARLLGRNVFSAYLTVILPMTLPVMVTSATLACLEVLSDYGVTSHFGIHTFSTGIFQAWFGMHDVFTAIKVAFCGMVIATSLIVINRVFTNTKKIQTQANAKPIQPMPLTGVGLWLGLGALLLVSLLSSIVPITQMLVWAVQTLMHQNELQGLFENTKNTLFVATIASVAVILFSLIVCNVGRYFSAFWAKLPMWVGGFGYSFPSPVMAIGVLGLLISVDKWLFSMKLADNALLLTSTLFTLVFAYVIKYAAVGINGIDSGFTRVGNRYSEASRTLGHGMTATFFKVDVFTIKHSIIAAFILVFIDIVKELPMTLLLRPYNFSTLATRVYTYAGDEQIQRASVPSLVIIFICVALMFVVNKIEKNRHY